MNSSSSFNTEKQLAPRTSSTHRRFDLAHGQRILFFPTFGSPDPERRFWNIHIRGWIHNAETVKPPHGVMLGVLRRLMRANLKDLESDLFQERIAPFFTAGVPGKRIAILIGSRTHVLPKKSGRNGHFFGTIRISFDEAQQLMADTRQSDQWLPFTAATPQGNSYEFAGRAMLIDRQGLSVISDIDDTIKFTDVNCRESMLTNTFLREFQSVRGMPELFQQWNIGGAAFHYVSSSPWQLFDALAGLCNREQLPAGTFHLRTVRMKDPTMLRLFLARKRAKRNTIASILKFFPHRHFLLVGDSGEKDPEIYGAIARRFPDQVRGILVRDIFRRPMTNERKAKAFRKMDTSLVQIFQEPEEISRDSNL